MTVDPVTLEVIRGSLNYVSEEMGLVLRNTAYSPNIKERMDHSCAIFDKSRRLAAQAEHIPVHIGSMVLGVQEGLRNFKGKLEEGDMIIFNDPYISGTHLPDITTIAPIFFKGETAGYTANKAHHQDVGGISPGSLSPHAKNIFQEGVIIPPVKIMEDNKILQNTMDLILRNVRTPKTTVGDLRAQLAANRIGQRRVTEIVERYGINTFDESINMLMQHAETRLRSKIEKLPKTVAEAEDWLENIGNGGTTKIKVKIAVENSSLKIDYSGTDPQVEGPINSAYGVTIASVFFAIKSLLDPELIVNDGSFRPVSIYCPSGTILNPNPPAAVSNGNTETAQRNVDVLLKAFAQIMPEKVPAACQGTMNNVAMGGQIMGGELWAYYETIGGGYGGRIGLDGENGIHSHMTNTMNTPVEAIEATLPIRALSYKLREGSPGAGRWRGGAGVERSFRLLSPATITIVAERNQIPPWGLMGGKEGKCGEYVVRKNDGKSLRIGSKATVHFDSGDELLIRTPGGGGYGDPLERHPESVLRDVLDELITIEQADKEYGVIIDPATSTIDFHRTESTRRVRRTS